MDKKEIIDVFNKTCIVFENCRNVWILWILSILIDDTKGCLVKKKEEDKIEKTSDLVDLLVHTFPV